MSVKKHELKNYIIYSTGKVYSKRKNKMLKSKPRNDGYISVNLDDKADYLHRVIYESFIGKIPTGYDIDHLDNDRGNNDINNLQAITHKENIQRSFKRGRKVPSGKEHPAYGTTRSDATKKIMSEKKLGANHPKFNGYWVINGTRYGSTGEAARALGTYPAKIHRYCTQGKDGYSFEPL
jgi:hypothetical protein